MAFFVLVLAAAVVAVAAAAAAFVQIVAVLVLIQRSRLGRGSSSSSSPIAGALFPAFITGVTFISPIKCALRNFCAVLGGSHSPPSRMGISEERQNRQFSTQP